VFPKVTQPPPQPPPSPLPPAAIDSPLIPPQYPHNNTPSSPLGATILEAAEFKCVRRVADTPRSSVCNGAFAIASAAVSLAADAASAVAAAAAALLAALHRGRRTRIRAPLTPADG